MPLKSINQSKTKTTTTTVFIEEIKQCLSETPGVRPTLDEGRRTYPTKLYDQNKKYKDIFSNNSLNIGKI